MQPSMTCCLSTARSSGLLSQKMVCHARRAADLGLSMTMHTQNEGTFCWRALNCAFSSADIYLAPATVTHKHTSNRLMCSLWHFPPGPSIVSFDPVRHWLAFVGCAYLAHEWCNICQSDKEEVFVAAGLILEYMRFNGATDVPQYLTAACPWVSAGLAISLGETM